MTSRTRSPADVTQRKSLLPVATISRGPRPTQARSIWLPRFRSISETVPSSAFAVTSQRPSAETATATGPAKAGSAAAVMPAAQRRWAVMVARQASSGAEKRRQSIVSLMVGTRKRQHSLSSPRTPVWIFVGWFRASWGPAHRQYNRATNICRCSGDSQCGRQLFFSC